MLENVGKDIDLTKLNVPALAEFLRDTMVLVNYNFILLYLYNITILIYIYKVFQENDRGVGKDPSKIGKAKSYAVAEGYRSMQTFQSSQQR